MYNVGTVAHYEAKASAILERIKSDKAEVVSLTAEDPITDESSIMVENAIKVNNAIAVNADTNTIKDEAVEKLPGKNLIGCTQ